MGYVKRILRSGVVAWNDPDLICTHREDLPTYINSTGATMWFLDGASGRPDKRLKPTLFPSGVQSDMGGEFPAMKLEAFRERG
jgi:hypothetical protein